MVGLGQQGGDEYAGGTGTGAARRVVRVLPAALIAVGLAFDVMTPPSYTGSPFFSAAPLIAAPLASLLITVLTGMLASLAVVLLHVLNATTWKVEALTELVTVVTVSGLAVLINRVVRRSGEQLASARGIAEAAQRAVLPKPAERIAGLHVCARYEAAQADAFIGGDLYAVQDTPYGVRLAVGDVRGKGLGAVEAVAVVLGAFREAADTEPTLEGLAQRLERALAREGTRRDSLDAVEGSRPACSARSRRGPRCCAWSTGAIPSRCCCTRTGAWWSSPRRSPRCRSAWGSWPRRGRTGLGSGPSRPGPPCCCTRTG